MCGGEPEDDGDGEPGEVAGADAEPDAAAEGAELGGQGDEHIQADGGRQRAAGDPEGGWPVQGELSREHRQGAIQADVARHDAGDAGQQQVAAALSQGRHADQREQIERPQHEGGQEQDERQGAMAQVQPGRQAVHPEREEGEEAPEDGADDGGEGDGGDDGAGERLSEAEHALCGLGAVEAEEVQGDERVGDGVEERHGHGGLAGRGGHRGIGVLLAGGVGSGGGGCRRFSGRHVGSCEVGWRGRPRAAVGCAWRRCVGGISSRGR